MTVEQPRQRQKNAASIRRRAGAVAAVIVLLVMLWLWMTGRMASPFADAKQTIANERVAVRFHNYLIDQDSGDLSDMAADYVQKGLAETAEVKVVSHESATRNPEIRLLSAEVDVSRTYSELTGAKYLLEGAIFRVSGEDSLMVDAVLVDLQTLDTIAVLTSVSCSEQDPMICVEAMGQNIWEIWSDAEGHSITLPSYPSYSAYMQARRLWQSDPVKAEKLLLDATALDRSFVDPQFLLLDLYAEVGSRDNDRRARLDSIRTGFPNLSSRQKNLFEFHQADYRGENVKAYELFKQVLEFDPLDLFNNTRAIKHASEYMNRNQEALDIFAMIPVGSLDFDQCDYCDERVNLATRALVDLGRYEDAEILVEKLPRSTAQNIIAAISPPLRQGDEQKVLEYLREAREAVANGRLEDIGRIYAKVGIEARLLGNENITGFVADTMFEGARGFYIEALLADQRYEEALSWMGSWVQNFPNHRWVQGYAGLIYARMGKTEDAKAQLMALERIAENRAIFDRGEANYYRACIFAILGDFDSAFRELDTAYFRGCGFIGHFYNNDPFLAGLIEDPRWEMVLNPN